MEKIIVISGGFDPIHSGHIDLIVNAGQLGKVVVLLNSEEWLIRKKGKFFMTWNERAYIINNIKNVIDVISFDDSDDTAIDGLVKVQKKYNDHGISFANGGDRDNTNTPEKTFCIKNNIEEIYEVGGSKTNASSELLKKWSVDEVERPWGNWKMYKEFNFENSKINAKFKSLTINPGKSISHQKHKDRNEIWLITSGKCEILIDGVRKILKENDTVQIFCNQWHLAKNIGNKDLEILEVQYGDKCDEEDIVRR